jgi:hypothetical protein
MNDIQFEIWHQGVINVMTVILQTYSALLKTFECGPQAFVSGFRSCGWRPMAQIITESGFLSVISRFLIDYNGIYYCRPTIFRH